MRMLASAGRGSSKSAAACVLFCEHAGAGCAQHRRPLSDPVLFHRAQPQLCVAGRCALTYTSFSSGQSWLLTGKAAAPLAQRWPPRHDPAFS